MSGTKGRLHALGKVKGPYPVSIRVNWWKVNTGGTQHAVYTGQWEWEGMEWGPGMFTVYTRDL